MDPASRAAARRLGLGLALAASLALACASRPVVYVDPAADAARRARVERDIDECRSYAKTHTREGLAGTGDAARSTVRGGAVGAAAGAVGGAIWGSAGRGAATGAAAGATSGLLGWMFGRHDRENQVQRRYVERCLADRGHQVLGWD